MERAVGMLEEPTLMFGRTPDNVGVTDIFKDIHGDTVHQNFGEVRRYLKWVLMAHFREIDTVLNVDDEQKCVYAS